MRFKSKKAIVTGASSGVGKAIAERLSAEGAELIVVGRNTERLENLCKEISGRGGSARFMVCDLSDETDRKRFCDFISEVWDSKVDVLINSAGINIIKPLINSSPDLWRQLMEINVIAPSDLLRRLIPKLSSESVVINISSVAGIMATPGNSVYSATKAALLSFTRSAAAELASKGIRVNAILPGLTKTPMMEKMFRYFSRDQQLELEKKHLLGLGTPDDVAAAVTFIASPEAKWITGSALVVDGGFTLSG